MIGALAWQSALALTEACLNRALRLDATGLTRLAALAGKVIEVQGRQPALRLYVLPGSSGLALRSRPQGDVSCRLSGPSEALAGLIMARDKKVRLQDPSFTIEGEGDLLPALFDILDALQPDWGYALSRRFGPVAGGLLAEALRRQGEWRNSSRQSLQQDVADYLSEESRALVGRAEGAVRFAEIDELAKRLERLQERLKPLADPMPKVDP